MTSDIKINKTEGTHTMDDAEIPQIMYLTPVNEREVIAVIQKLMAY